MLRGQNSVRNLFKITIISISFIVGAYGCSGISPTGEEGGGGVGAESFLNPDMIPQYQGFLEFTIDQALEADLGSRLNDSPQALKMISAQGEVPQPPPLDFSNLEAFIAGLPVRVNGNITVEPGDGQHTLLIDLTFSFCFPPTLPEGLPTLPDNETETETAQIELPEFPELPEIPDLRCGEGQEIISVRIVGEIIIDDETGEIVGGSLMINDQLIGPTAACEFLGENLEELAAVEDLLGFCEAP